MDSPNILDLIDRINNGLDTAIPIILGIGLAVAIFVYTRNRFRNDGPARGSYLGILALIETVFPIAIIYTLPQLLVLLSRKQLELFTARWIILYLVAILWSYRVSYKKSGWRGLVFVMIILTTLLFGWLYGRWLGMFFMSMPVLLTYFYIIYRVAQVILPALNPEDKSEMWKKTRVFLAYLLGVQHPIWMPKAKTGSELERQLDGNATNEIGKPGIIWTWSHQVAAISKGIGFNRVNGPGLIFTDPYEAPVALVDLRMQSRVCTVHTVTKDGMEIPTVVFTAFAVDKRDSPTSRPLRRRAGNGANSTIDHPEGSFPYSSNRVLAVLSTTGINNPRRGEAEEKRYELLWDEWVVKQVEHVTRLVVAERSLDELWHPQHDDSGVSALNEIAVRLQELLSPQLAEVGVNLFTVRIVNYQLPEKHQIIEQNIKTWSSYWEQQITAANADMEMIYREEIEKAHAYSKSMLLSAIADSIAKARNINDALPRHMIAQYYIHALEEYIKGQPGVNVAESKKRIETVKEILMTNHMDGNE